MKYLEITATPQKDEQGNLSGYIILIEDETPYADLIEKKETIESPPDCIVTINKTGEIYGVNPAFYAFFESEVANDDTKGKSLLDYFGIQNTERIINIAIPSACDHGAHIWTGEMILKNIPVMIILTIDESSGISLIIQDISERKLLEEKALELSKLAGVLEVCGAVCHEVNQPLQGIFGYLDLIDIDKNLPEPLKQKLKIIRNSANRISTLTRQLLSITRKKSYRTMNYPVSKGSIQIVDIPNS